VKETSTMSAANSSWSTEFVALLRLFSRHRIFSTEQELAGTGSSKQEVCF
jgi:hypothetical protein